MLTRNIYLNISNKILSILALYALAGFIIFSGYFDILQEYGIYNEKRILQILLLAFVNLSLLFSVHNNGLRILNDISLLTKTLLFSLLMIGCISLIRNDFQSTIEFGIYLLIVGGCFSVGNIYLMSPTKFTKVLIYTILSIALLQETVVVSAIIASYIESTLLLPHELFLNYSHVRFFNQVQSWTLPLIVLPLIYAHSAKTFFRQSLFIIAAGWWWLLFATGGRGTLLGFVIAAILTSAIYKSHAKIWIQWQILASGCGALLYLLIFFILPGDQSLLGYSAIRDAGSSGRFNIWVFAWESLNGNFLMGIGPAKFSCLAPTGMPAHPHNFILQVTLEWGAVAALLTIFFICRCAYLWTRNREFLNKQQYNSIEGSIHCALFSSFLAATIHSFFSGVFLMPHSQSVMILIAGWMLGIHVKNNAGSNIKYSTSTSHVAVYVTVILLGTSIAIHGVIFEGTTHSFSNLNEINQPIEQKPRIWQEGKICSK